MSYPAHAAVRPRRTTTLLAAVTAMALLLPAASALAEEYVALGDSYASGTGTRTYYDAGCERSVFAYNYLIRGDFGSFRSMACGGAKVQNVIDNQVGALSSATKQVTISVGGNDAGFSSVVTECALTQLPWNNDCADANTGARNYINNTLPGRLNTVYSLIRQRAPNAVVTVVGYPRLFNGEDCHALTFFSGDDMNQLNGTADILSARLRERARAHGFTYVDPRKAFEGHQVCDGANEWINNLSNPTGESYHPNRAGHELGFAPMVRAAMQAAPSPSAPDGGVARVAFSSTRDGNPEIYVVNENGQFPVRLTNDGAADIDPAWSPDGTKVAFASNRDGDNEIYVMNGDGTGVTKLTNNTSNDQEPAWSPNGDLLAFRSDRTGNNEVYRITDTGGSATNLTNNSASDFNPDWSPDGAEIVFQRFGSNNEVMKANASGQGQINLSCNSASDGEPSWAPNGTQIAFHSNRDGDFEIFTFGPEGGTATNRTANTVSDQDPAWSPNDAQIMIAFTSSRTGNDEIFTMPWGGGTQTNRTNNAASDTSPSWQADSTKPTTTVTGGPNGPVADARPSFTFTSNELGSTMQCRVDSAAYAACTSPYRPAANLGQGEHTFSVRATDPTGNVDDSAATRTFVVDTVAPQVTAACPPPVELRGDAVATVTATDATSGMAAIDDPSGEHELDTSVPGVRTFTTLAIDLAGNDASAECTYEVVYPDPGQPALSEGSSPNAGGFALGWTPSAPAEYPIRYTLQRRDADGSAATDWEEVATGLSEPRFAFTAGDAADEGTWTYRVRGIDAEHDADTGWSTLSLPVVVDQTAPRAPKLSADRAPEFAGDGGWFADTVDVTTAADGDPDLRDGSTPSGVDAASVADDATLTETATVRRTVRDRVGNESSETAERFQVDTDVPELALTCPDTVELLSDTDVTVAATDAGSGLAQDPSGTVAVDTDSVGVKTITRTATDNVGHTRTTSCDVLVVYPTPGTPELAGAGNPNAGDFTVGWKPSAPAGYPLRYVLERRDAADGAEWEQVREGLEDARFAFTRGDRADEGTWVYRVRGVDAENDMRTPWSEVSAPVTVDQTAPAAPSLTPGREPEFAGDGGWWRNSVTVHTSDNGDPALRDGSAPSGVDQGTVAAPRLLEESATLRRTVSDRAGNESETIERRYQVDTRRPELSIDCPTSVLLGGEGIVTVAASDDQSGLDQDPTDTFRIDTSEVGTQTFERTATDRVGHSRTVSCDVLVRYGYEGLLQPVNRDGSSIFKLGSTVPLKLVLTDADGRSVTDAVVRVELEKIASSIDGERVEETVRATPTNGKAFAWNGEHYRFNLSTNALSVGTWRVLVSFDDGTEHRTRISLR